MTKKSGQKTIKTGRTRKAGRKTKAIGLSVGAPAARDGLGRIFAGRAILPLLKLFFLSPSREFYQRELVAATAQRLFVVQTALKRLAQAGVIEHTTRGNRAYYRANERHPAFADLRVLVLKTVGLGESLRAQLQRLKGRVNVAFIYGSVARGDERLTSDVDLMFVGDVSGRELASILAPARQSLNREINPTVYTPEELHRKARERSPFIREVLTGPKIFLIGDERALAGTIGRRLP